MHQHFPRSIRTVLSALAALALIVVMPVAQGQEAGAGARLAPRATTTTEVLDIDANNATDALTDGLLVIRYLFGLRSAQLVAGAVGAGATRSTSTAIESYLAGLVAGSPATLDIDNSGTVDALTDGLIVLRYLFGVRGSGLVNGALGTGAQRTSPTDIENYMATLTASQPHPPALCTIAAVPASSSGAPLAPGTSVQLTASCASGQQPITYTWDGGAFVGAVRTVAPTATTTYSVVASNAAGTASAVTTTVYVAGALNFCHGSDEIIDVAWVVAGAPYTTNGFLNQTIAFRVVIPYTFSPPLNINHLGSFSMIEEPGQSVAARDVTISKNSCDFTSGNYLFSYIGTGDPAPTINFTVNNPTGYRMVGANVNFQSGDVVYMNVRNANNGAPSCMTASCDMYMYFTPPNSY